MTKASYALLVSVISNYIHVVTAGITQDVTRYCGIVVSSGGFVGPPFPVYKAHSVLCALAINDDEDIVFRSLFSKFLDPPLAVSVLFQLCGQFKGACCKTKVSPVPSGPV